MSLSDEDVHDLRTFAAYCQQMLGTPLYKKDYNPASVMAADFFKRQSGSDWRTLTNVVRWCKDKNRHPATIGSVIQQWRYAWSDGYLKSDEFRRSSSVEEGIRLALMVEMDVNWRAKLLYSEGMARAEVLEAWQNWQKSLQSPDPVVKTVKQFSLDDLGSSAENS